MEPIIRTDGVRDELPDGAAPLIDLAARWMRDAGLIGPLPAATLEFTLDEHGRVRSYYAKTRGGRHDLLPVAIDATLCDETDI